MTVTSGASTQRVRFRLSGDRVLIAAYGTGIDPAVNEKVRRMAALVLREKPPGIEAVVPSYTTLSIHYDPLRIGFEPLRERLLSMEALLDTADIPPPRTIEIPVCYGGRFGPDIDFVARHNELSEDEVIRLHTGGIYPIYAVGFAPGFCYLGGLSPRLHTPRLETPRVRVPAGSVGIANTQTGVYPLESPGGWQLIGRTPLKLFSSERQPPVLYEAGDRIRFRAITEAAFHELHQQ